MKATFLKRILSLILAARLLTFSLTACGDETAETNTAETSSPETFAPESFSNLSTDGNLVEMHDFSADSLVRVSIERNRGE